MSDHQKLYKEAAYNFGIVTKGRIDRAEKHEKSRKKRRADNFIVNRQISESITATPQNGPTSAPVVEDRLTRLKRWKAERDRRKNNEKMNKKRPFTVGIVHHKIYSPISVDGNMPVSNTSRPIVTNTTKRITRATEKRLLAKATAQFTTNKIPGKKAVSVPNMEQKDEKMKEQSFAPMDYKFKAPVGVTRVPSELFGRVRMPSRSPLRISDITSLKGMKDKSGTTEFIVETINDNENTSLCDDKADNDFLNNTQDSSIETISLKVSSDEPDVFNSTFDGNHNGKDTLTIDETKKSSFLLNDNVSVTPDKEEHRETDITPVDKTKKSSFSSNDIVSATLPSDSPNEPAFFSPYVVTSRGKSNARKEQQVRRGFSIGCSPINDIPTKDTVMKTLNISVDEEERTAQYFQFILNKEIERLTELCGKWTEIKSEPSTTEEGQYQINQAVGQTTLLINKKFERFRSLVLDCETGKGEMLVTCKDLQGFWDMMYMEIEDCDARFNKLEKLRSENWVEEQPALIKPIPKKKVVVRKKVEPAKTSNIRAFLLEKKRKMEKKIESRDAVEESGAVSKNIVNSKTGKNENSPSMKSNYRRSNKSFGFNEEKCTSTKRDGTRLSLLQKVQLSETSKHVKSPLTLMKISKMCKTPEVKLDDTISYVNSDQTPGKSILKCSKDFNATDSRLKSTHKVNFDDHVVLNDIPIDEETQTKMDLAAALSRIDSFNLDDCTEEVPANVERRLDFSDDSFEDLSINIIPPSPCPEISEGIELNKSKPRLQKQYSIHDNEEINDNSDNIRILRSKTIVSKSSPKRRTRSSKRLSAIAHESEHKENRTPTRTRKNNTARVSIKNGDSTNVEDAISKISLDEDGDKRRRSTRKSVKFTSAMECTACQDVRPALPMTPHVRRSKARNSESKRKSTITEDLISWETPEKPPERIRRSRIKKA